jgi:hypothetical protein
MSLTLSPENGIDLNGVDIQDTALANAQANDRSFKNLIINGAMQVAQRGTSFSSSAPYYSLDRWQIWRMPSSQSTDVPTGQGFVNSLQVTASLQSSGAFSTLEQKIENEKLIAGQELTFSFWIKGSVSGTAVIRNFSQSNETGFAHTSFDVTTGWQKVTSTFTVPSLGLGSSDWCAFGIDLNVNNVPSLAYSGSGVSEPSYAGTVNITGVQLEISDVATPFEHRPYGLELALCQRYYTIAYKNTPYYPGFVFNNSQVGAQGLKFPVTMRVAPAITAINPYHITTAGNWGIYGATNGWSSTGYTPNFSSISSDQVVPQFSGVSGVTNNYTYICSGGFIADAEL